MRLISRPTSKPISRPMSVIARTPVRRPKAKSSTLFERDRTRGIVTCACLSAILAAAIIAGSTASKTKDAAGANPNQNVAFMGTAGELQSGAILFVPVEGNICRRRLIDNDSWRIRDDGFVTCDEAVTWNSGAQSQKYFVAVRVDAIRSGFKANLAK
jgi:hypothetical protein